MGGLGSSDDADGTKDGKVDFKAPADGSYFVSVKDMLARGGSDFVYRVEAVAPQATIEVTMPEMLRRELQYLKQFNVPQGGYFSMVVNTTRKAVAGPEWDTFSKSIEADFKARADAAGVKSYIDADVVIDDGREE